jgi:1-acyl-sn-glycerol-3-phosphate acyltransferase
MKIFAKIRFYWGAFTISFIVAVIMIPLMILFPKRRGIIMHHLNRLIIFLMGGRLEQVGEADPTANLVVMNHQGIIDIVGMEALQKSHFRWVAKKELFDAFWFGNLLKYGDMISIDRNNKAGLLKLTKDVKESIEVKHRAVAIFPEGTRAKNQELLPFKAGTKFIAQKLDMRVQPVVITGSKRLLNEHNKTGHNATVRYIYMDAFDVSSVDKDWFERLRDNMQKRIDDELSNHNRSR